MAGGVTRVDSALGERIYRGVQASWLLKIVATIFSISGDEAIWYAIPSVIITSTYAVSVAAAAVRAADGVLPSGCAEQALCDLFGSASICGLAESLAKWLSEEKVDGAGKPYDGWQESPAATRDGLHTPILQQVSSHGLQWPVAASALRARELHT